MKKINIVVFALLSALTVLTVLHFGFGIHAVGTSLLSTSILLLGTSVLLYVVGCYAVEWILNKLLTPGDPDENFFESVNASLNSMYAAPLRFARYANSSKNTYTILLTVGIVLSIVAIWGIASGFITDFIVQLLLFVGIIFLIISALIVDAIIERTNREPDMV